MAKEGSEIVIKHDANQTAEVVRTAIETAAGRKEFTITLGDITEANVEAIVCPANPGFEFSGIGGVEGAIARKAGMRVFQEAEEKAKALIASGQGVTSDRHGEKLIGAPLGFAISTLLKTALGKIRSVIHVNNMRVEEGLPPCDKEVVRRCVGGALASADSAHLKSVAFPAIGTGIWGVSMADSLAGTLEGMRDYYRDINPASQVEKVSFVVYAQPSLKNATEMQGILMNNVFPKLQR